MRRRKKKRNGSRIYPAHHLLYCMVITPLTNQVPTCIKLCIFFVYPFPAKKRNFKTKLNFKEAAVWPDVQRPVWEPDIVGLHQRYILPMLINLLKIFQTLCYLSLSHTGLLFQEHFGCLWMILTLVTCISVSLEMKRRYRNS